MFRIEFNHDEMIFGLFYPEEEFKAFLQVWKKYFKKAPSIFVGSYTAMNQMPALLSRMKRVNNVSQTTQPPSKINAEWNGERAKRRNAPLTESEAQTGTEQPQKKRRREVEQALLDHQKAGTYLHIGDVHYHYHFH